jgi:flagellar motor switch protein FliM/flagellar motor switch protein FliG
MDGETRKTADIFGKPAFAGSECKVIPYDFKRPDKFSLEQIRTSAEVHESFARTLSELLSVKLRSSAEVKLKKVDQMTMHEYLSDLPDPACISTVRMKPLQGSFLLELNPELRFILTNRLYGGTVDLSGYQPEMSAGEEHLYRRFNSLLVEQLNGAWQPIIDLQAEIEDIRSRVTQVTIASPTEMVITVSLEAGIEKFHGGISLCYPFITIEPLIHKLSMEHWFSFNVPEDISGKGPNKADTADLRNIRMHCEISTESAPVPIDKIRQLRKGDLIPLPELDKDILSFSCGLAPLFSLSPKEENGLRSLHFDIIGSRAQYFTIENAAAFQSTAEPHSTAASNAEIVRKEMTETLSKISEELRSLSEHQMLLQESLYPEKADTAAGLDGMGRHKSFTGAGPVEPDSLFLIIQHEHPQISAAVLGRVESETAAMVLDRFETDTAVDIAGRIAAAGRCDHVALTILESYLKQRLQALRETDPASNDGVQSLALILNVSSVSLEKEIVKGLEKTHADLAEEIKKRMFIFEDIVMLDEQAVSVLLEHADPALFALAMKTVQEDVKEKIYELMEADQAEDIRKRLANPARVRIRDVETAQEDIIELLKHLEESGKLTVGRGGEVVD